MSCSNQAISKIRIGIFSMVDRLFDTLFILKLNTACVQQTGYDFKRLNFRKTVATA